MNLNKLLASCFNLENLYKNMQASVTAFLQQVNEAIEGDAWVN